LKSVWNIGLARRKVLIVDEVLQRKSDFIVIRDKEYQREHKLSWEDFPAFDWPRIKEGTKIVLVISGSVAGVTAVSPKSSTLAEEEIFLTADCIWRCPKCDARGEMDVTGLEDYRGSFLKALDEHARKSPGCHYSNVIISQMIDGRMTDREDLTEILGYELVHAH